MKIVHITTGHHPFDTRVFQKQCKSLAANGYLVNLVVPHDKDIFIDGVHISAIKNVKSRFDRIVISPWRALSVAIKINADVYHLHDPDLIPIGLILKLFKKKIIFDSHEDFPADILSKTWIPINLRKFVSKLYSIFERFSFSHFDSIITVHEQIHLRIVKYQPKTFIVKNYPILNNNVQLLKRRQSKFIWLGMLGPVRGCFQLDEAVSNNDNLMLDVIGTVLEFTPVSKNIKLLGGFNHQKAMQMAAGYLAGIVTYLPEPNHVEALPNKLFEYMSLGLPVIASNFPKWREIVEEAKCGILVNPNSPQEICEAMLWYLNNQEEALEMGLRGRDAVIKKYSWSTEEEILFDTYEALKK
jgi:glycosyltransferase involved in cell wall biosynthesis